MIRFLDALSSAAAHSISGRLGGWVVVTATALLAACSYVYTVEALFIDGKLSFVSDEVNETGSPYCLISFKVSDASGSAVWEFDAYDLYKNATKCGPNFPLRYGQAPKGAVTVTPAKPLKAGELYTIEGNAGNALQGSFRYQVKRITAVENLDMELPEVKAAQQRGWDRQRADH
ncbi:hypothetical protein WSK_1488 [Novosphingobium sp. Rr 2-17]|uniref:hypothetical protein n=1 Tax=Novosphingobium sp. Rr 2-17 TaxID=555793 RepID=UPI00026991C1|nr:hypothetical protein [Novosphingobium sp. Rr 2-17]EIZ79894.1 hypothetical protein WSK_1488 [Novosphingobium sp. Rr 2-17]